MHVKYFAVKSRIAPGTCYRDVKLEQDQDGKIHLLSAQQANLVQVETVEVEVVINVKVKGNKSVPCVGLEPPAMVRTDNRFTILLAETDLPPEVNCVTVRDPFQISIPLPGQDLESGSYRVEVNDVGASFDIEFQSQPIGDN